MNTSGERRRHPRLEIEGRIDTNAAASRDPMTLLNLSLGGFLMQTSARFTVGEVQAFRLTIDDKPSVVVRGRIIHTMRVTAEHLSSFLYGVECDDDESRFAIESLISPPGDTPS